MWSPVNGRKPAVPLAAQRAALERCMSREPLSECAGRLHSAAPLVEGIYGLWLRALLRALPAAQVRVLRAEDFRRQPERAAREAFRFLQVETDAPLDERAKAAVKVAAAQEKESAAAVSTLGEEAASLAHFYEEHAVELVQMMDGDERFAWSNLTASGKAS